MLGWNVVHPQENVVCPQENVQPRGGFGGGSYKERGGQIVWRAGSQNFKRGT